MPRQARLDVPGALHHIIVRGINKAPIFKDDQDKTRFLERLGENVLRGQCTVNAWVLDQPYPSALQKRQRRHFNGDAQAAHLVRPVL